MMYHLNFSLTGGASCSVGCSEAASPPAFNASGFCSSRFCCSSAMIVPSLRIVSASRLSERKLLISCQAQNILNAAPDDVVHQPEVRGKDEDCHDHHGRRRPNFSTRW